MIGVTCSTTAYGKKLISIHFDCAKSSARPTPPIDGDGERHERDLQRDQQRRPQRAPVVDQAFATAAGPAGCSAGCC
jgi:hypothetical protein